MAGNDDDDKWSEAAIPTPRWKRDFEFIRELGRGSFGSVHHIRHKVDKHEYALKRVRFTAESVLREVYVLSNVNHRNIARYFACWVEQVDEEEWNTSCSNAEDGDNHNKNNNDDESTEGASASAAATELCTPGGSMLLLDGFDAMGLSSLSRSRSRYVFIQMELCRETLKEWICRSFDAEPPPSSSAPLLLPPFQEAAHPRWDVFGQLLTGLAFLHSKGYLHRDLKPTNILISRDGHVKIADLGLAQEAYLCIADEHEKEAPRSRGTYLYSAPELDIRGAAFSASSDMYAAGIVLLELWLKFGTSHQRRAVLHRVRSEHVVPKRFAAAHPFQSEMVLSATCAEPEKRPSAAELLPQLPIPDGAELSSSDPMHGSLSTNAKDGAPPLSWTQYKRMRTEINRLEATISALRENLERKNKRIAELERAAAQ